LSAGFNKAQYIYPLPIPTSPAQARQVLYRK
jgi:hypothetical protein